MAKKRLLGIEIGSKYMKMAVCENNIVLNSAIMEVPEGIKENDKIQDMNQAAVLLEKMLRENGIREREAAVVVPDTLVYTRNLRMPLMNEEQLRLNLPYEFRDFIGGDATAYNFDFAMKRLEYDADGKPTMMDLLGVAAPKELIDETMGMCRDAGLKPVIIAPESCCFGNLLTEYEKKTGGNDTAEYCIIDIGYTITNLMIYRGNDFEVGKRIEYGCKAMEKELMTEYQLDEKTAHEYLTENRVNCQDSNRLRQIYDMISIEVMRAINFYGYNTPDSNLGDIYFAGGGSQIEPLVESIIQSTNLQRHSVEELYAGTKTADYLAMIPTALGVTYEE